MISLKLRFATVVVCVLFPATAITLGFAQGAAIKFDAPAAWISKTPSSSMRLAEFTLPKTGNDAEDATVTVFYFGGQGGNVQANIDRWIGQIAQPDGKNSKDLAKTSTMQTTSGMKVTMVDVSG